VEAIITQPRSSRTVRVSTTLALIAGALFVITRFVKLVDRIPNDAASFQLYNSTFNWAMLACATVLMLVILKLQECTEARASRAVKIMLKWIIAGVVLWVLPIPFGAHRVIAVGFLLPGAAMLLLASLRIAWNPAEPLPGQPHNLQPDHTTGPICILGALAATLLVLIHGKAFDVGWAFAVD
jgi:hypothetical protein